MTPMKVAGKRAWIRQQVEADKSWIIELPDAVKGELLDVVAKASGLGQLNDGHSFREYSLTSLNELVRAVSRQLYGGYGFVLLKHLPLAELELAELKFMLMVLGQHLGIVTPQTGSIPEIGEVMDTGGDAKLFYYNRGGALPMHMDPVDVVGLLCVRKAKQGGESGLSSSMTVHNEILKTRPDLLDVLYRGYRHHRKHVQGDAEKNLLTDYFCPVYYPLKQELICSMIPHVIEGAVEQGLLTFTTQEREALDTFKAIAARDDFRLHMDLEPGDLQLLNNRCTLHNRLDYEDYPEAERRRLLLRLWLTMPAWEKLPPTIPHKDAELYTNPA